LEQQVEDAKTTDVRQGWLGATRKAICYGCMTSGGKRFPEFTKSSEEPSFDFILFSFNGIDYASHKDRLKIFQEIKRVGKQGCYFFFSSHNLQALEKELTLQKQIVLNPVKTYVNLVMLGLFWLFNQPMTRETLAASESLIVRDESHNFRLETYYIRAAQQIRQLSKGFSHVEIYPWQSTERVLDLDASAMERDLWLYYLCRVDYTA
ncbi:MAG: hypothetical protein AAGI69_08170, partial [Cyanobacteria bacterium P01_H01_bin.21]